MLQKKNTKKLPTEKALARVAEQVERDLELVGVTAIEDKLADGVPAAVAALVRGGVKVWMITGDKQETAVNIGVACRLLRDPGRLLRCNAQEGGEEGADARLAELLEATEPWAEGNKDGGKKKKKFFSAAAAGSSSSSSWAAAAPAAAAAVASSNNSSSAAVPAPYPSDVTMRPAPISTASTPGESGAAGRASASGTGSGVGGGSSDAARTAAATLTTVAAAAAAGQLPPVPVPAPPPPLPPPRISSSASPPLPPAIPPALYSSSRPPELVIDGRTLSHVLGRPAAEAALAELAVRCSAVVVCRASPSQKAGIVRMMKARRERARLLAAGGAGLLGSGSPSSLALPSMALRDRLLRALRHPMLTVRAATSSASNNECLLAIGDGANDVAMLQAADIGVGLLGKEGRQAANNADFAFARFASLPRLLLVHGTLADYRLSRLIKYSFYKNVAFAAMLFCFQFFNGFSGQALLDGVTSAFYNAFFTALPAGFFAGLDRPVRHLATLEAAPRAYNSRPALTAAAFWRTSVLSGVVHGAVSEMRWGERARERRGRAGKKKGKGKKTQPSQTLAKKNAGRLLRPLPVDAHPGASPLERRHLVPREDDVPGDDRSGELCSFLLFFLVNLETSASRDKRQEGEKPKLLPEKKKKKKLSKKKITRCRSSSPSSPASGPGSSPPPSSAPTSPPGPGWPCSRRSTARRASGTTRSSASGQTCSARRSSGCSWRSCTRSRSRRGSRSTAGRGRSGRGTT